MDIQFKINDSELNVDKSKIQKMIFLYNVLENGWTVRKKHKKYIFVKSHDKKKEVYSEDYLAKFIKDNSNIDNLFA